MNIKNELKALGPWLVLIGVGVVILPIYLVDTYVPLYSRIFISGYWETMTNVNSRSYLPLWGFKIIGEIIYNSIVIILSTYLVYLFFTKQYLFPRIFIYIAVLLLMYVPLEAWLMGVIMPNLQMFTQETINDMLKIFIGVAIVLSYILLSKKVKTTFVN